jgi:hypothetical protein
LVLPPDVLLDELEVVDVLGVPLVGEPLSEEGEGVFDSLVFDSDLVSLGVPGAAPAPARESLR